MSDQDNLNWLKADPSRTNNAGRSKHVAFARVAIPVVFLFLIAVSVIWSQSAPTLAVKEVDLKQVQNTLETARFSSMDKDGQPFVIEADRVIQQDPTTMAATLAAPHGEMKTKEGQTLSLTAKDGLYNHNDQNLKLNGDVVLKRDNDLTMETQELDVDLAGKNATGDQPVTAVTAKGDVLKAANGVELQSGGEKILFKGPASLTLQPKSQKIEP